jgi:hypothetical protein
VVHDVLFDGSLVAAEEGRRVYLDPSYVAEAVQLGYACTDYGNEGVTTARSVTSVGAATSAGGLYVGVTRGRYDNTLYLVAHDREDARAQLVAALGRDRSDRGLDVARARAEDEAWRTVRSPESAPAQAPREPGPLEPERQKRPMIDPAHWRTETELDQMAQQVEVRFSRAMRALRPVRVMPDAERQRENAADQDAAVEARREAAAHRAEADRIAATRDELVEMATTDYFAAREDARVIETGPGRFARKAAKVDEARAHRSEVARRWSDPHPPGSGWSDEGVRRGATGTAERILNATTHPHRTQAEQAEKRAEDHDRRVTRRDRDHERATGLNKSNVESRAALVAKAERDRARIAQGRELRRQVVATMSPEEVSVLDDMREALLRTEAALRDQMEEQLGASAGNERFRGIEREGPGLEI